MFADWLNYFWNQLVHPEILTPNVYNLPWFFVLLHPLTFFGKYPALFVIQVATIGIIIALCRSMNISWARILLVLTSAPVFSHIVMGQIDGLILLAYLLPPLPAAFLVISKPQTALWAGWEAFRKKPFLVIPFCIVLLVTAYLIWGWPLSIRDTTGHLVIKWMLIPPFFQHEWNWTFFPWAFLAIPVAVKYGKKAGMFLSPFIFPYAALNSLIAPVIAAATARWYWFVGFWLLLWLRWAWMAGLI